MSERGGDPTPLSDYIERARLASQKNRRPIDVIAAEIVRDARAARARHLEAADPAITAADILAIITDTLRPEPPLQAARAFLKSDADLLILNGDMGVGKSVAAAYIIAARGGGVWVSAMDVVSICDGFNKSTRWDQLLFTRTLVVDDCGLERDKKRFGTCLTEIVNRRQSRGRRTVLTGNMNPDEWQARYNAPRLWDRVKQCVFDDSEFTGPSLRGVK